MTDDGSDALSESDNNLSKTKQHIVFCVLILLANTVSLLILLTSPKLKKMFKYHVMASMSIVNIMSSLLFFPRTIHFKLHQNVSPLSTLVTLALETAELFAFPSIIFLSVISMGADYVLNRNASMDSKSKYIGSIMGLSVSWLYGVAALIPCAYQHNGHNFVIDFQSHSSSINVEGITRDLEKNDNPDLIISNNGRHYHTNNATNNFVFHQFPIHSLVMLILVWGLLPLAVVIVVTTSVAITKCLSPPTITMRYRNGSRIFTSMPLDSLEDDLKPKFVVDIVLASLAVVGFHLPHLFDLMTVVDCSTDGQCMFSAKPRHNLHLLKWSIAFLLPATWTMDGRFRDAAAKACGKLFMNSCVVY